MQNSYQIEGKTFPQNAKGKHPLFTYLIHNVFRCFVDEADGISHYFVGGLLSPP